MPIKFTSTVTRPSADTQFRREDDFWISPDTVSYITDTYEATGKLLAISRTDLDPLTTVWVEYWDTIESFDESTDDVFLSEGAISNDQHRQENNITVTYVTEDVPIDSVPVGVFSRF